MDSQEIRDRIMAAINGIIKDDSDGATANLHDVLAAKMRARIQPNGTITTDPEVSAASETDVAVDDVTDDEEDISIEDDVKEDIEPTEE